MKNLNKVEIIKDSVIGGERIITTRLTYPRFIHSEVLRHRNFSNSVSSSRAIPLSRIIRDYAHFSPTKWRKHQPGMQPNEDFVFDESDVKLFNQLWALAKNTNEAISIMLHDKGVAKEIVNRLNEPFSYVVHMVQQTYEEYKAMLELRTVIDAQFEFREIALMLLDSLEIQLKRSDVKESVFHAPFLSDEEYWLLLTQDKKNVIDMLKVSSARCARTSYYNHDGKETDFDDDMRLSNHLIERRHPSPFEFPLIKRDVAIQIFNNGLDFHKKIDTTNWLISHDYRDDIWVKEDLSGNLKSPHIVQFRKIIEKGLL